MMQELSHTSPSTLKKRSNKTTAVLLLIVIMLIAALTLTGLQYKKTKDTLKKLSSAEGQQELAKKETNALLEKVGKLMVLPGDEDPIVATITDKDLLSKEQPFYANASNGDRVIAYIRARKAIIYDPIRNVIVNAGPIYVSEQPK